MSGYPEFNFPAFYRAEEELRSDGWDEVFNPAKKEIEKTLSPEAFATGDVDKTVEDGFNMKECYLWDIEHVIKADAIYLLKGWEKGAGARGEHAVACVMQRHYPEYEIIYE